MATTISCFSLDGTDLRASVCEIRSLGAESAMLRIDVRDTEFQLFLSPGSLATAIAVRDLINSLAEPAVENGCGNDATPAA